MGISEGGHQTARLQMSDRVSLRRVQRLTFVCFAEPASARRIHPPAFGLPPFGPKGRRFDGQAKRLLYFRSNLEVLCRTSISKGALAYRYSQYVR